MNLVITLNKEKPAYDSIQDLLDSLKLPKTEHHYNLGDILFISDKKIINIDPITIQPQFEK